jgi:hypothetical protein
LGSEIEKGNKMKTFKWVVEFETTTTWVEDGFNIDQGRATDMIANALPFASGAEFKATVLKSPDAKLIRRTQGYTN